MVYATTTTKMALHMLPVAWALGVRLFFFFWEPKSRLLIGVRLLYDIIVSGDLYSDCYYCHSIYTTELNHPESLVLSFGQSQHIKTPYFLIFHGFSKLFSAREFQQCPSLKIRTLLGFLAKNYFIEFISLSSSHLVDTSDLNSGCMTL